MHFGARPTLPLSLSLAPEQDVLPGCLQQMKNTHLSASSEGLEGTVRGGLLDVLDGCSVLYSPGPGHTRNLDSSAAWRPRPGRSPCASGYLTPLPPSGAGEGFNASSPVAAPDPERDGAPGGTVIPRIIYGL